MSIEELEELRKKTHAKISMGFVISAIIAVLIAIIFHTFVVGFIAFVLGVIIFVGPSVNNVSKFNKTYKQIFVLKGLEAILQDVVYEPKKGIDREVIANTKMMNMGNKYFSNDLVIAKYKNIELMQADVRIKEEYEVYEDGERETREDLLFQGKWMVFDFNKSFKSNMQVCEKNFLNVKITNSSNKKFKKVMMEDQAFNDIFNVYAQSEHEAFYILTPQMMEKMKRLEDNITGGILFCFVDNKLHVGIQNNKDSFEPSLSKEINEEEIAKEISKEIKLVTSFIDELDLDNDLFRKEV